MTGMIFGWEMPVAGGAGFVHRSAPMAGDPVLLGDAGDGHALVVAPTGAGKSRGVAIPNLLSWDGPAIVLDLKGELAATTARYRREALGQRVVLLDPWRLVTPEPDALDPLEWLETAGDDLADECLRYAAMLTPQADDREAFWQERAASLLAGIMAALATDPAGEGDLYGVHELLTRDDAIYNLATLLDTKRVHTFAHREIASFLSITDVTRSGILATAINAVRLFGSRRVSHAVGESTFDLDAVVRGDPLTIYLIVPPANLRSHAALIRLWLSALMSLVTSRRRLPEKPTLWVLDEFAQLGPMPQLLSAVTLSRSYGMRCLLLVQSLGQLRSAYPADHGAIIENCMSLVTFGHASRAMSAQLAELLGDVSAEALFHLPRDAAALQTGGQDTRIVRRLDYLSDPLFAGRADPHPMFHRKHPER